jgi:hypothetical protein
LTDKEKQEQLDDYTRLRITNNIKPNDDIPDSFMLMKFENNSPALYIFLDEDWQNIFPDTNIIYGENFKQSSTLTQLPFQFTQQQEGIYINKITENLDFYFGTVFNGGTALGPITKQQLSDFFNEQQLNLTFIYMR